MNRLLFIIWGLFLSGCVDSQLEKPQQLGEWTISTMAPKYYSAYVDILLIVDEEKQGGWKGMVTTSTKFSKHPNSWEGLERYHSGYTIRSAKLPASFYIRWYSLANKKTYNKTIKVSEDIRRKMREYHEMRCGFNNGLYPYKDNILLGLAPDGMISVFLNGTCFDNELQFKVQAVEYKVADDFVYPELSEEAQAYVDEHGVPTGIW
ncbi:DUF2931 family protein [Aliivibrio fischeri]|uniref:DUF2931 family protein n=1 Tax=Aliivibrio fischeri TaxID=668 RepID=UPI0007C46F19|nr:DUF2931 family protein [Aliivibrio fischeri]MCE7536171.1 DUF2931 family protein [Aliivibrio fischeri]MCE7555011.1 DUF2931 family protein [Aliivibrio fischeri]MCE7558957.1 DUF2931 family protein [Aliivibrio fischeri]MCE7562279.1 DUF2931 family protein [Aliivibrio fischeri]MCE7569687.1 DUF2931 family protein [Aliivibrio fischeri]